MARTPTLPQRRQAVEAACAAMEGLAAELWNAQGEELAPLMELFDRVEELAAASRFAVVNEGVERGDVGGSTGGGTAGLQRWVRDHAPSLRAGGSAAVVTVVEAAQHPRFAAVKEAVADAVVPVGNAACVVEEYRRIAHRLKPAAKEPVLTELLERAKVGTRTEIRRLRPALIARYGVDGEFQCDQDHLHQATSLSQPHGDGSGLFEYRMVADGEAKAALEAAIQALSAPRPADGEPDQRPSRQRRFEALLEVVRRGVASADGVPSTPKAQLMVTMDLPDLVARTGAGTVLGSSMTGDLIGPETIRRIACGAGVTPVVLGGKGEILDLGRTQRLFSAAQIRALWLRDQHCTFPGCTVPAAWCDAHHLWHWVDGGPTDLDFAALACDAHHTVIHRKGLHGQVVDGKVVWDLTPGSYDHWLRQRLAAAGDLAAGQAPARQRDDGSPFIDSTPAQNHVRGDGDAKGLVPYDRPEARSYDVWGQLDPGTPDEPPPPWHP
ncbi:HNH endonuclease signature motif containing protein [Knoellia koreensis]|uniref:DUF222 domain-containing protein n=1 Tax=Knoellia koreensis TaxID=2730921 RepID=A0A849HIV9_9MICO|nr:HNH endonuclease signature motif containing protein [Knoellia sp. DB2414S]NNM46251.1 DUF222 domain-containing protein [Knoellia sp. DB2414S]